MQYFFCAGHPEWQTLKASLGIRSRDLPHSNPASYRYATDSVMIYMMIDVGKPLMRTVRFELHVQFWYNASSHLDKSATIRDWPKKKWCQFSKTVMSWLILFTAIMAVKRPGSYQLRFWGYCLSGFDQSFTLTTKLPEREKEIEWFCVLLGAWIWGLILSPITQSLDFDNDKYWSTGNIGRWKCFFLAFWPKWVVYVLLELGFVLNCSLYITAAIKPHIWTIHDWLHSVNIINMFRD